jgi:hypothetical protein
MGEEGLEERKEEEGINGVLEEPHKPLTQPLHASIFQVATMSHCDLDIQTPGSIEWTELTLEGRRCWVGIQTTTSLSLRIPFTFRRICCMATYNETERLFIIVGIFGGILAFLCLLGCLVRCLLVGRKRVPVSPV